METKILDGVAYLNSHLFAMLGSDTLVRDWWESPNLAFQGKKPYEVYLFEKKGRDTVIKYIMGHCNGAYY